MKPTLEAIQQILVELETRDEFLVDRVEILGICRLAEERLLLEQLGGPLRIQRDENWYVDGEFGKTLGEAIRKAAGISE